MKWVTYESTSGGEDDDPRVGLLEDGSIYGLAAGLALVELLGDDGDRLHDAAERVRRSPTEVIDPAEVRLRAPIPRPRSIRDFSAFEEHIRTGLRAQGFGEISDRWYECPVFWFCNPNSVVGPDDPVTFAGNAQKMDYELEIGVVIGRTGINLDPEEAERHVAGYCVMNDWSARDLQADEMHLAPIGPAKGKDFATGFGPYLVTPDELEDRRKGPAYDLAMTATVNGQEYSRGNFADIYWRVGQLISYASRQARLYPGDLLGTGTCGTGCLLELTAVHGEEKFPWLKEHDEVVLEVERLGVLRNRVHRGPDPKPLR